MCFGSFRRKPVNPLQNEPAGAGDGRLNTKKHSPRQLANALKRPTGDRSGLKLVYLGFLADSEHAEVSLRA